MKDDKLVMSIIAAGLLGLGYWAGVFVSDWRSYGDCYSGAYLIIGAPSFQISLKAI